MENNGKVITEETGKKLVDLLASKPVEFAKKPVTQIRNNQIFAGVVGTVGLVMFALGIENLITQIPQLSTPYIEIVIGLVLLSISGLLLKKLS